MTATCQWVHRESESAQALEQALYLKNSAAPLREVQDRAGIQHTKLTKRTSGPVYRRAGNEFQGGFDEFPDGRIPTCETLTKPRLTPATSQEPRKTPIAKGCPSRSCRDIAQHAKYPDSTIERLPAMSNGKPNSKFPDSDAEASRASAASCRPDAPQSTFLRNFPAQTVKDQDRKSDSLGTKLEVTSNRAKARCVLNSLNRQKPQANFARNRYSGWTSSNGVAKMPRSHFRVCRSAG